MQRAEKHKTWQVKAKQEIKRMRINLNSTLQWTLNFMVRSSWRALKQEASSGITRNAWWRKGSKNTQWISLLGCSDTDLGEIPTSLTSSEVNQEILDQTKAVSKPPELILILCNVNLQSYWQGQVTHPKNTFPLLILFFQCICSNFLYSCSQSTQTNAHF